MESLLQPYKISLDLNYYTVLLITSLMCTFQEVKHKILFLLEMLEPFLDPAIFVLKSTIEVGNISFTFTEKQKHACDIALNVIRTAVQKSAVLPSLESEWRLGSVAPRYHITVLYHYYNNFL